MGKLAAFFVFGLLFFSWVQTSLTPSFKYRATKGWGLTNTWNFLKAFYPLQSYSCNTVLSNIMWYNVWFCPFCGGSCISACERLAPCIFLTLCTLQYMCWSTCWQQGGRPAQTLPSTRDLPSLHCLLSGLSRLFFSAAKHYSVSDLFNMARSQEKKEEKKCSQWFQETCHSGHGGHDDDMSAQG